MYLLFLTSWPRDMTKEVNLEALKTLCGALHYDLTRYGRKEFNGRDFELLLGHLGLPQTVIYGIEVNGRGFTMTTKAMVLRYVHDDLHYKRKVEVI
jgi:hypothetical protein